MDKDAGFILPIPSWGGGDYLTNQGLGLQAGYTYLLGGVPIPYVGLRAGGRRGGVSLAGPLPMIGLDTGERAGMWEPSRPRSLWKLLGDKIAEMRARNKTAAAMKVPVRLSGSAAGIPQEMLSAHAVESLARRGPTGDFATDAFLMKVIARISQKREIARALGASGRR